MPPATIMVVLPSRVAATKIAGVPFCSPHSMTMAVRGRGLRPLTLAGIQA